MFFRMAILGALFIGCTKPQTAPPPEAAPIDNITWDECDNTLNHNPCNIETYDQANLPTDLYSLYGKPIILDFSAAWGPPCVAAAKEVQAIQDANADSGLVYITVLLESVDSDTVDEKDLSQWAKMHGIKTAPVWAGTSDMIDVEDQTKGWFVIGYPTFYFIDKEMVIRGYNRGYQPDAIAHEISLLLEE